MGAAGNGNAGFGGFGQGFPAEFGGGHDAADSEAVQRLQGVVRRIHRERNQQRAKAASVWRDHPGRLKQPKDW
jgi:hypothetical protein